MDAVCAESQRDFHVVVNDKGHVARAAKRANFKSLPAKFFIGQVFLTELHKCGAAGDGMFHVPEERSAVKPGAVRNRIEQKGFLIEFHRLRPPPKHFR